MGLSSSFDIAASGMLAQRQNVELISQNIANASSTGSINGQPYQRQYAVFSEVPLSFAKVLEKNEMGLAKTGGVNVTVVKDASPSSQRVFDPGHPDADENGYVSYPNVSMAKEMTDLVYASKLYEANITVMTAIKKMSSDTLQLQ